MAPRRRLAAASIVTGLAIGPVPEVSAQTIVEAKTWDDAISKLDCKDINKNADGSFSLTALIKIKSEEHHNPIVNVPRYKSKIEAKKMLRPGSLPLRGVGCWHGGRLTNISVAAEGAPASQANGASLSDVRLARL